MNDTARQDDRPIGDIVREITQATEAEVKRLAEVAEATGSKLGEVLVNSDVITPDEKQRSLGRQWGIPFIDLREFAFSDKAIKTVPDYLLKEHKVIPLKLQDNVLTIAVSDPLNVRAKDEIRVVTGFEIELMIAVEEEIMSALDRYLGLASSDVEGMVENASKEAESIDLDAIAPGDEDSQDLRISEAEPVIVRLVSLILAGGISMGSTSSPRRRTCGCDTASTACCGTRRPIAGTTAAPSPHGSRSWPASTSRRNAAHRTAASRSTPTANATTCGCRPSRASTARRS